MSEEQDAFAILAEREQLVEDYARGPEWELITDYAKYLSIPQQNALLEGRCRDWDEYKYASGYVAALQTFIRIPEILQMVLGNQRSQLAE